MRSFFVHNLGCRASQADGAAIEGLLRGQGLRPAPRQSADLIILNTCTVTAAADGEARQLARRLHRDNPKARILITGCYAQRAPEELIELPGVAWVVGNSHKTQIAEIVRSAGADYHGQIQVGDISAAREFLSAPVADASGDRTRPNLKIQDGCNARCAFCIIPAVRGRSRSAPAEQVLEQVRRLASRYQEIVLSGINLGRWGRDLPDRPRLEDLLRRLLDETEVRRLRLSSVEPMDWTDELLGLMAESPRIAKHVHAPLQSGSDAVLRRMRRRYRVRHYEERILKARRWMPQAAIGADVMTGFPGETEEEFEETRRFIEALPFTYLHVFTYSERPGTEAAGAPHSVPPTARSERTRILRALAEQKNLAFRRAMVGQTLSAVTLEACGEALSDNYLRIALARPRPANQIVELKIGGVTSAGLREASPFAIVC